MILKSFFQFFMSPRSVLFLKEYSVQFLEDILGLVNLEKVHPSKVSSVKYASPQLLYLRLLDNVR